MVEWTKTLFRRCRLRRAFRCPRGSAVRTQEHTRPIWVVKRQLTRTSEGWKRGDRKVSIYRERMFTTLRSLAIPVGLEATSVQPTYE